jgi:ABC-type tungstate transport system permease subunit
MRANVRLAGWPRVAFVLLAALILSACRESTGPDDTEVVIAVDPHVHETGLLEAVLPAFEDQTGYEVAVVPADIDSSLEAGRLGEVDAVLTGDPGAEEEFVAGGYGVNRQLVMRDAGDPARIYHVMQVEPAAVEGVQAEGAGVLIEFLISDEGQSLIGKFSSPEDGPAFVPQADGDPEM